MVLKPENIELVAVSISANTINPRAMTPYKRSNQEDSKLEHLLRKAYEEDPLVANILEALRTGQLRHAKISLAACEI